MNMDNVITLPDSFVLQGPVQIITESGAVFMDGYVSNLRIDRYGEPCIIGSCIFTGFTIPNWPLEKAIVITREGYTEKDGVAQIYNAHPEASKRLIESGLAWKYRAFTNSISRVVM